MNDKNYEYNMISGRQEEEEEGGGITTVNVNGNVILSVRIQQRRGSNINNDEVGEARGKGVVEGGTRVRARTRMEDGGGRRVGANKTDS